MQIMSRIISGCSQSSSASRITSGLRRCLTRLGGPKETVTAGNEVARFEVHLRRILPTGLVLLVHHSVFRPVTVFQ